MRLLAPGLVALVVSLALTRMVREGAQRLGLVAVPRNDRWHRRPTATLGGLAIYGGFMVGVTPYTRAVGVAYPILAASSLLFVVGLVDDFAEISARVKFAHQLVAAGLVVWSGLTLLWTGSPVVNDLVTIVWLVGITNAINLLDNMDGLAAGISAIAAAFLTATFVLNGQADLAVLPVLLCGAALGFLAFNFKPASIFMGDCGSMFLGSALGGIALLSEYGRSRNLAAVLLAPVLILTIPIVDTCLVTITRKLSGRPVSQGGRDHTSHRLVALGASERRAVLTLYVLAALCGLFALAVRSLEADALLALLPGFALVIVLFARHLGRAEVGKGPEETGAVLPGLRILSRQRVAEGLLDVLLIFFAYYIAYLLRFDWEVPPAQRAILVRTIPIVVVSELGAFFLGGVYRELWLHAEAEDLLTIGRSVLGGAGLSAVLVMVFFGGASRSVLILNLLLLLVLATASRLGVRLLDALIRSPGAAVPGAKPVLIYGTGSAGALLAREILNNATHRYTPVGFFDDDATRAGLRVHGLRIFGRGDLATVIQTRGVSEILVPSSGTTEDGLTDLEAMGVFLRRVSVRFE